jgi:hypothetical protein
MDLPKFENAQNWWQAYRQWPAWGKIIGVVVLVLLLAAPLWSFWLKFSEIPRLNSQIAQQNPPYSISNDRREALRGQWTGTAHRAIAP